MTTEKTPPVPHHVEETVATIACRSTLRHYREARALQKRRYRERPTGSAAARRVNPDNPSRSQAG